MLFAHPNGPVMICNDFYCSIADVLHIHNVHFCYASEEVVAHPSKVSSLVLGKSSSRLLATGGEDCKVNIWAVNKPNCIMVVVPSDHLSCPRLQMHKEGPTDPPNEAFPVCR